MKEPEGNTGTPHQSSSQVKFIKTGSMRPEGYDGSCLRPLGLCELGGSCDICWYNSERKSTSEKSIRESNG